MKKYFYILPRQVGKTSTAVMEVAKDPEHTLYIAPNLQMLQNIQKEYPDIITRNNSCISSNWKEFLIGKEKLFTTVILDEYFFFNKREEFTEKFSQLYLNVGYVNTLLIYSTPDRLYDRECFEKAKEEKQKSVYAQNPLSFLRSVKKLELSKTYFYNFLTDPDTILIGREAVSRHRRKELQKKLSVLLPDRKLEYTGEYLSPEYEDIHITVRIYK